MVNKIVRGKLTTDIGTKLSKGEVDLNIKLAYEAVEQIINGSSENGSAAMSGSNLSPSSRKVATESENGGREIDDCSTEVVGTAKARTSKNSKDVPDEDSPNKDDEKNVDPLEKQNLTNIRIKVSLSSKKIVGVTADSLVPSESGREVDSSKRQSKKVSWSRSDFKPAGVNQLASGNWVSEGNIFTLQAFCFLILILLCSCLGCHSKFGLATMVNIVA